MKTKILIISLIITLCIVMPMWYFLLYSILKAIEVDRLVWFIFWVYIPVSIFTNILGEVAKHET